MKTAIIFLLLWFIFTAALDTVFSLENGTSLGMAALVAAIFTVWIGKQ